MQGEDGSVGDDDKRISLKLDFDGFLAALSSRKRKTIRRERRSAQSFGGEIAVFTGDTLRPEHWDAFWEFYQDTGARKWGTPYLTRKFFDIAQETLVDDILLILAMREGRPVYLCWRYGEEEVRYWHELDGGFAGRLELEPEAVTSP